MTAEITHRSAVFFSKLNARYRLKNGKIYDIIRYRQIGIYLYSDIKALDNKAPIWYNLINYYIGAFA